MEKLSFARETTQLDWTRFHAWESVCCLPAIALMLGVSVACHEAPVGMIAAGAALNVGFGSFRKIQNSRLVPMALATVATSFSAFAGTLLGHGEVSSAGGAAIWGFIYGMMVVYGDEISWVFLQSCIALLVAQAFPGTPAHALIRGGLIFGAGVVQMTFLAGIWRLQGAGTFRAEVEGIHPGTAWRAVRAELNLRNPASKLTVSAAHYALRMAVTLALAVLSYQLLHLQVGYWLPLTTLLVLKPDFYRTYAGGFARVIGTLGGVIVATLLTWLLRPQPATLIVLVVVFCYLAYAFQKVNYAIFTGWVTSFIVFLVAIAGLPETTVTVHRLLDTALGSGIALISRTIGFTWKKALDKAEAVKGHPVAVRGSGR